MAEAKEVAWSRIHRADGQRALTVQGDVDRDLSDAQELLVQARAEFIPGLLERYPGLRLDVEGDSKESAKTGQSIGCNVLLGLIRVYMLLAVQFRGYLAPITVMLVIRTAFIGAVFGHMTLGLDLTMPSIVGMASLFGVAVNDSILLVAFIRQERGRPAHHRSRRTGVLRPLSPDHPHLHYHRRRPDLAAGGEEPTGTDSNPAGGEPRLRAGHRDHCGVVPGSGVVCDP